MLEGASIQSVPPVTGKCSTPSSSSKTSPSSHRRNVSDVMLGRFENLSLSTPTPIEPSTSNTTNSTVPNWPSPFRPTPLYQYPYHSHRSARNLHSQSYSDYTHPYVTTPPPPPPQHHRHQNGRNDLLTPYHQHHRRAVSTSTLDMMLNHHQRLPLDHYSSPPALLPSHSHLLYLTAQPCLSRLLPVWTNTIICLILMTTTLDCIGTKFTTMKESNNNSNN
ncbi:unnamed protein product [Absidia cylindrospora]